MESPENKIIHITNGNEIWLYPGERDYFIPRKTAPSLITHRGDFAYFDERKCILIRYVIEDSNHEPKSRLVSYANIPELNIKEFDAIGEVPYSIQNDIHYTQAKDIVSKYNYHGYKSRPRRSMA